MDTLSDSFVYYNRHFLYINYITAQYRKYYTIIHLLAGKYAVILTDKMVIDGGDSRGQ